MAVRKDEHRRRQLEAIFDDPEFALDDHGHEFGLLSRRVATPSFTSELIRVNKDEKLSSQVLGHENSGATGAPKRLRNAHTSHI